MGPLELLAVDLSGVQVVVILVDLEVLASALMAFLAQDSLSLFARSIRYPLRQQGPQPIPIGPVARLIVNP